MGRLRAALYSSAAAIGTWSAQSALAGDLSVAKPAAPVTSPWEGFYASVSAGGSRTGGNETLTDISNPTSVSNAFPPAVPETNTTNAIATTVDNQHGTSAGAVLTFTLGYDVVRDAWLAGIRSEISLNGSNIRTQGASQSTMNQTNIDTLTGTSTSISSSSAAVLNNLDHKWTVSELARLGYLVRSDLLVYGLAGWSWGGFEWNVGATPFTMDGPTWGAGVEQDFGWMRAFVQYKGISYRQAVDFSNPSSGQSASFQGGALATTFSQNTADSALRRFSAAYNEVTAGVTIPLGGRPRAAAAGLPLKAPALTASPWDGPYASFAAGGSWTSTAAPFAETKSETDVLTVPIPLSVTTNTTTNTLDSQHGRTGGAVATFAMGYETSSGTPGWRASGRKHP
jgi:opacity protein-like surface antigen